MIDLWIFACLGLVVANATAASRSALRASRLSGIGGPDEDLEKARRLCRAVLIRATVAALAATAAIVLGFRGAPVWRQTGAGQAILNIFVAVALIGVVVSFARTIHQEWSARGSTAGLVRETLLGFPAMVLLMLAVYFRFGA